MTLPVGVVTRNLSFGRPFDTLGGYGTVKVAVTPQWGGTTQALVWTATGDPWEAIPVVPPTQSDPDGDPYEIISLPVVDQTGWQDGLGRGVTGWNFLITAQSTFVDGHGVKTKLKARTKLVSPLTSWALSPAQDFDLLPDGTSADPVLATPGAITSVAGLVGASISASNLVAALAASGLMSPVVTHGTDPNVARPTGASVVIWYGTATPAHMAPQDIWTDAT